LVKRAHQVLKDKGGSGFERLRREADAGVPEAIRLRKDLRAFYKDSCNAPEIKWQDNDRDKQCYARALELIVDELRWQPLLERAQPLLTWIARLGNPDFLNVLVFDDITQRTRELMARKRAAETVKRKRELARIRKANQRKRERL